MFVSNGGTLQVWQQVKAANPGFSICEIGATIGRMWRELADEEKQRHMDDFNKDKVCDSVSTKSSLAICLTIIIVVF